MVLDERVAGISLRSARAAAPDIASPVTAESRVEDDLLVVEGGRNVTSARELRSRLTPGAGVGVIAEDVFRDVAAGEEVDADGFVRPLCSINTTVDVVESSTIALLRVALDGTTSILILVRRVDIAVRSGDLTRETSCSRIKGAIRSSV